MKTKIFLASMFVATAVMAQSKSEKVTSLCEQQIVNVVTDKFGRNDDTFSVVGYKVIYKNLFSKLAVVRTSDEVEPRDVLVEITENENYKKSCEVKYKEVLADGSVSDIDEELVELTQ
jgi:hypothetical protein